MADNTPLDTLEIQLAQHHISIDVLPTFFQMATLDRSGPDWRTTLDDQICACIQLLGGVREPDLIKITGVDQSTINRRVRALHKAGTIRVSTYTTGSAGKPAKWLQMPESADLDAEQRADHLALTQIIIAYRATWLEAQTPPPAPEPEPEPAAEREPSTPIELDEPTVETETTPPALPTAAEEAPTEPAPPADTAQPHVEAKQPPEPASPPIKRIPTPYPMPPAQPVALTVAAPSQPSFWYRSFYYWMTPLVALGLFSFIVNERVALVAFATQVGIPLVWLIGAIALIAMLVEYRETVFANFHPIEHRILALTCGLIIAVAVVQSGLWAYARALWNGTPPPAAPRAIPTAIPEPAVLTEPPTPTPEPSCTDRGTARVTAPRGLRLRQDANTSARVLTTIPHDTTVTMLCAATITADGTQWVLVQHGEHQGWVAESVPGARYLTYR